MAYLECKNCKKSLIEGDMCTDCASFLRPVEEAPKEVAKSTVKEVVEKVKKAVKRKK